MPPEFAYPDLPIARHRQAIADALRQHQVVVVVGETGSGKTTQLPKIALEVAGDRRGILGCTQPRRLAAVAVARRIAEEVKSPLGGYVGYQVRFDEKCNEETRLKLMTDGILLAETQTDRDLRKYHTIILDEAHERSLNIDFLLGYLKLLLQRRRDLKLIISSATMDAGSFAEFFDGAPVVSVEGRTYPVDMHYMPPHNEQEELPEHVARAVHWLSSMDNRGDVLVFLPGEREIREVADKLAGENLPRTAILPLFARLGLAEQQRIFQPKGGERRIVLATNVAETSLTIPGIIYVIDSGLARLSRYSPARQVQRLQIEEISQASARQRAGRCGRVCEGVCIRLYSEENWEERPPFTDPEIRRSALAGVILRMADLNLPPLSEFPLPDPPSPKLINEGYRTLREIGAFDKKKDLTPIGHQLARLPIDPRLGRMLLEANHEKALAELLVIVSGLSIMDPRERPGDCADKADAAQAKWRHEDSDFLGMLLLWQDSLAYKEGRQWRRNQLRKWCSANFLNMPRILEWHNLHEDLSRLLRESLRWKPSPLGRTPETQATPAMIHRSILAGGPLLFGIWKPEEKLYRGAGGRNFGIFPGSGMFRRNKRSEWIMGVELVETTRLWMRRCAVLDPAWVEQIAPQLCTCHAYDAAWDQQAGAVYAKERVNCGGLVLIDGRRIHYGRHYPKAAREIMIREGILQNRLRDTPPFLQHLADLREEIELVEYKLRRRGQIWYEDGAFDWLDRTIPQNICTEKALRQWRDKEEKQNPEILFVPRDEAMYHFEDEALLGEFPDTLAHAGNEYSVYYNDDPGSADDGVTLGLHIEQLRDFPDWLPGWGVPGHLARRAECLLRSLPKDIRVFLQPITQKAEYFAELWNGVEREESLADALSEFVETETRRPCRPDAFDFSRLPAELVTKIWVCDDEGKELALGTDITAIRQRLQPLLDKQFASAAVREFPRTGMTKWDCGDLPSSVQLGTAEGYPALQDGRECVKIHVYPRRRQAEDAHRHGIIRLLQFRHGDFVNHLRKKFPLGLEGKLALSTLGQQPKNNLEDLVHVTMEGAVGTPLPRTAEAFDAACIRLRENLFDIAKTTARLWDSLAITDALVREYCLTARASRHTEPIARDLENQLAWLMRPRFLMSTGYARLQDLDRFLRGIRDRLQRIAQQPVARELERMQQFAPLAAPYLAALPAHAQDPEWIDHGFMLEEYRLTVFAPTLAVKGRSSVKKLADSFAALPRP